MHVHVIFRFPPAINNDRSLIGVIKWIGAHKCINEPQGRGNWGTGTKEIHFLIEMIFRYPAIIGIQFRKILT